MGRVKACGWLAALGMAVAACGRDAPVPAARAETAPAPSVRTPTHVDSVVPRAVALERFQRASERVTALAVGAQSRDELVYQFVRAVEAGDTAALGRLVLSRAEFAYLYYPTSREGLPPYDLTPELMWFMMVERSNRGVTRLMTERAGHPLHVTGYRCLGNSTIEGANRLWGPCVVRRVAAQGDTVEERLFGPIIARGGRFKFVSYSNKL